jgi:hypothetical protein
MTTEAKDQHRRWLFSMVRIGGPITSEYRDRLLYSYKEVQAIYESKIYKWLD